MSSPLHRPGPPICAISLAIAAAGISCSHPAPSTTQAGAPTVAAPTRAATRALHYRALAAYRRKDFADCAGLFERAGEPYGAAGCFALAGQTDAAFAALARAIDGDPHLEDFARDGDLDALHGDPRWRRELDHFAARTAERRGRLNAELSRLYDDDQADRQAAFGTIDWSVVVPRDRARRKRVDEIVAAGGARAAADYYHAAMVYQHGDTPDEIQRAHDLAVKAVELDPSHDAAKWLAAAAEDRKLMYENKPQKWGTQFRHVDGGYVLWKVDPSITDEQRDAWNVPPLADAEARVAQLNAEAKAHK
jgi:hypothetical protein